MRKIIRYSSLQWDETEWEKKTTWADLDTGQWVGPEGGISVGQDGNRYVIEDKHTMFALVSKISPAKMTVVPIESDMEPREIHMNAGGIVLIGNGFVYYDTKLGDIKL